MSKEQGVRQWNTIDQAFHIGETPAMHHGRNVAASWGMTQGRLGVIERRGMSGAVDLVLV